MCWGRAGSIVGLLVFDCDLPLFDSVEQFLLIADDRDEFCDPLYLADCVVVEVRFVELEQFVDVQLVHDAVVHI